LPLTDLPQPIKDHILRSANCEDYQSKPNTYSLTELLYCIRKTYYRRTQPKPTDLEAAFNMYRGKVFDNLWSPLFQHNQVRSTHRCKNIPITISGKYDFLTTDNILTDLKTTKSLYFVNEPSKEYKTQVRFYAWLNSIDKAQIVYIDFGDCKVFPVEVGDCTKLIEDLERKAEMLYIALRDKTLPYKPITAPEWLCKKCEYNEECNHAI
jgi:hypothetical protein